MVEINLTLYSSFKSREVLFFDVAMKNYYYINKITHKNTSPLSGMMMLPVQNTNVKIRVKMMS